MSFEGEAFHPQPAPDRINVVARSLSRAHYTEGSQTICTIETFVDTAM
jgi:hypothetical protein